MNHKKNILSTFNSLFPERAFYISIIGISLLVLSSCQEPTNETGNKTVFRYNEASGISSLDPAFAKGQADIWACNQLYNGLVQMDDQLEIKPCIASRWQISADGKRYDFFIRNDVYFHDDPV